MIVREGNIRIRIWRNATRHKARPYEAWEFRYRREDGKPQRVSRASKTEAIAKAREIARVLSVAGGVQLDPLEGGDYRNGKINLQCLDLSIAQATHRLKGWMRRAKEAGCKSNAEQLEFIDMAVDARAKHHRGASTHTIGEIVAELLEFKRQDGASAEHRKDLKSRLTRLVTDHKDQKLPDLTAPRMEDWLRSLNVGNRSRKNFRSALSNLVGFARSRGYLPRDWEPMKSVAMPKQAPPKRGIFTPEEFAWLLNSCTRSIVPVLLLGSFAGLRQSETLLVKWSDIDWEAGHIRVPEEGKTGGRLAPLLDNLRAWLEPLKAEGPIVAISGDGIAKAIVRSVARTNAALKKQCVTWSLKWPHNGPRHSYASYRCAITRNVAQVADEMGHSIRELQKSYRNHKATPAQARAWFEIRPAKSENVLQLPLLEAMSG